MAYALLNDIRDWEDEGVLLVEVTPNGTAHVRNLHKQMIPNEPLAVPEAIAVAKMMMQVNHYHTGMMVRLQDGANWDNAWGEIARFWAH